MVDLISVENTLREYTLAKSRIMILQSELQEMTKAIKTVEVIIEPMNGEKLLSDDSRRISDVLLSEINTAERRCEKVVEMIGSIENPEIRAVLECRYYAGMTFSKIAKKIYMSKTKVQYLHQEGLRIIKDRYFTKD